MSQWLTGINGGFAMEFEGGAVPTQLQGAGTDNGNG